MEKKKLHNKILYYIVYVMTTQCDKIVRYEHQKNAFKVCEIQGTEQFRYAKELLAGEKVCFDRWFFLWPVSQYTVLKSGYKYWVRHRIHLFLS